MERLRTVPPFLARLLLERHLVHTLLASVRMRNDKIKERFGWSQEHASWRAPYREEISKWQAGSP